MAQDRDWWRALVSAVLNLSCCISEGSQLRGVSQWVDTATSDMGVA
jgi:hypothetical protein